MDNNATENISEKTVLQRMADLIAHAEISNQSAKISTHELHSSLDQKARFLDQQLRTVSADVNHFRSLMTQSGAKKLREETERLSQESKKETKALENICRKTKTTIGAQCLQLNKASMTTVKNVSQLISSVRKHHLNKLTAEKLDELQKNRQTSSQKIQRLITSLHWKNLAMVILLTIIVASVVSLYADNVWPWQAHHQILKQREAGKILLNMWPQLSHTDQEIIVQNA